MSEDSDLTLMPVMDYGVHQKSEQPHTHPPSKLNTSSFLRLRATNAAGVPKKFVTPRYTFSQLRQAERPEVFDKCKRKQEASDR